MNRKYKLLKKWPDSEIGDIYQWNGQGYSNQTRVSMVISKNYVEKFPDWFEEVTDTERTEVIKIEYLAKDIIGKKHIDIKLSSCIYEDQFPAIKEAIENVLNLEPKESPTNAPEQFVIGVDPIRGNFEWKDDAQTQVVFKREEKGEWIAMYRKDEPWSQQKFEADMKKVAEYFSKVPLLCEECREIGKHKPTCSTNTPKEENKEQSKDWEIVSGCAKNGDIHEWYNDNSHGGESCWQQKCKIRSVRRLSDNTVWTVGELTTNETGYLYKPIKKFIEHDGVMYVQFDEGRGSNDGCLGINALKKLPPKPQPLSENIVKPPLGLMPEYLHKEQRLSEIKAAVQRYLDVNMAIPIGWIAEQYCIENWLKNKSKQSNY